MSAQLRLFDYRPTVSCSCADFKAMGDPSPANSLGVGGSPDEGEANLITLVSQLDELKFGWLCQHVYCAEDESSPADQKIVPLAFEDSEVHLISIEDTGNGFSGYFFNQFVHLPVRLCSDEAIREYCEDLLHTALLNFRDQPELLEILDGSRTRKFYENGFGSPQERMPEDYFFITNVCDGLFRHDAECSAHFSRVARSLFRSVLGIPEEYCPGFHILTPETMLASAARTEIVNFLLDLLNSPSSYHLVAREGRISVVPTTDYGMFFGSASGDIGDHSHVLGTTVSGSLTPMRMVKSASLSEFELLLNAPGTKEADLQAFLESHPEFLFAMDQRYSEIRPHVCLYDANGERLVPDFMARIHNSNIWDVIELKLPLARCTVRGASVEKASATAARGIAELLRHRDFFGVRDNRRRVMRRFGIAAYEPCRVLVIGRGSVSRKFEWIGRQAGLPKVQVLSYDYLFEQAKRVCRDIDKLEQQRRVTSQFNNRALL